MAHHLNCIHSSPGAEEEFVTSAVCKQYIPKQRTVLEFTEYCCKTVISALVRSQIQRVMFYINKNVYVEVFINISKIKLKQYPAMQTNRMLYHCTT